MLDSVIELLPLPAQKVAKTIVATIGSILFVVLGMVEDAPQWLFIVLAILTSGAVYGVPNKAVVASKSDTSSTGLEANQDIPDSGIKKGDDVVVTVDTPVEKDVYFTDDKRLNDPDSER